MKTQCGLLQAKHLIKNEEGSTGVLFAMLALPMFALVGLAVDYARALNAREAMQLSLDAAVLAAANTPEGTDRVAIADKFFKANLKKVIADAEARFTIKSDGTIVGQAWSDVNTPIVALVSDEENLVGTSAEARPAKVATEQPSGESVGSGDVTPCIHVMDQSGPATFMLDSNSNLDASGCEVRVRSNHFREAMEDVASSNVKFARIRVKGYAEKSSGLAITQAPYHVMENEQVTGDPYDKDMTEITKAITPGRCTTANTNKTWTGTLNPGTYCGATEFKNVTFNSGLYIIATGSGNGKDGALKFSGAINGSAGVSFYLADNKSAFVSYNASQNSVLKAPSSGLTKGILFFENSNRGQNNSISIASIKEQSWEGVFYMPSLNLTLDTLSEWSKFQVSMSVHQLKLKSVSIAISPYSWTPYGSSDPVVWVGDESVNIKEGWLFK